MRRKKTNKGERESQAAYIQATTKYFTLKLWAGNHQPVEAIPAHGKFAGKPITTMTTDELYELGKELTHLGSREHHWVTKIMDKVRPDWRKERYVDTRHLRVAIWKDTEQAYTGWITTGKLKGKRIDNLSLRELTGLSKWCEEKDPDSYRYLCQIIGRGGDEEQADDQQRWKTSNIPWNERVRWAREILETSENPDRDEIKGRVRLLQQRIHPDKDGSNKLSRDVTEAGKVLMEERERQTKKKDGFGR